MAITQKWKDILRQNLLPEEDGFLSAEEDGFNPVVWTEVPPDFVVVTRDGAGNIVNPGFNPVFENPWAAAGVDWPEASAAPYRGVNCGACGRDEMERVFDEYDDDGYELTVKMACNSCSAERLDVYRFHHYE